MAEVRKRLRVAPSALARALACPGSIMLGHYALPQIKSDDAKDGDAQHAVLDWAIDNWPNVELWQAPLLSVPMLVEKYRYPSEYPMLDEDQMRAVCKAFDVVVPYLGEGWTYRNESRAEPCLPLRSAGVTPGRLDFVSYHHATATLVVVDFKFGFREVAAEGNAQMMNYAAAMVPQFPDTKAVRLVIVAPNAGGTVAYGLRLRELDEWVAKTAATLDVDWTFPPPLVSGDHCRYCPARVTCPKLLELQEEAVEEGTPRHDAAAHLGRRKAVLDTVEVLRKAVDAEVARQLDLGLAVPGYKLVAGRGSTQWRDPVNGPKLAVAKWGADAYQPGKLRTPAQLRDDLPGGDLFAAEHMWKRPGALKVEPASSTKPEIKQRTMAERMAILRDMAMRGEAPDDEGDE